MLSALLALASVGNAQSAHVRVDPFGSCGEYEMRPVRKLTNSEAKTWVTKLRLNSKRGPSQQIVPEATLIKFAMAAEKDLFNWSRDKNDTYHRIIKSELIIRKGGVPAPYKPTRSPKDTLPFPVGHWTGKDWEGRPQRQLSRVEAEAWIKDVERRSRMYNSVGSISRATLIKISTASSKDLARWILDRRWDSPHYSNRLAAYSEIAVRKDTSHLAVLHLNALADDTHAYSVIRRLDPSKKTLISLYNNLYNGSHTKDMAALDLLRLGDTRGASMVREAMEQDRSFYRVTGAGVRWSDEACYLLIRYADGNNRKLIERNLKMAVPEMRHRYADLAKLKRPAIDEALEKVAGY